MLLLLLLLLFFLFFFFLFFYRIHGLFLHLSHKYVSYIYLIQQRLLWALAIARCEAIVWWSLKQSIALCSYAQMPNDQLPKQPLLN